MIYRNNQRVGTAFPCICYNGKRADVRVRIKLRKKVYLKEHDKLSICIPRRILHLWTEQDQHYGRLRRGEKDKWRFIIKPWKKDQGGKQ